jgi:hypothetical protein
MPIVIYDFQPFLGVFINILISINYHMTFFNILQS